MVKDILFDLDETLFDFKKAERIALLKTLDFLGLDSQESFVLLYSRINQEMWKCLERGEITRQKLKIERFRRFLDEAGLQSDPVQAATFYEKSLSEGHYYIDGAEEVVFSLKERYNLYIVSNGTYRVQTGRLSDASITPCFKDIFISEQLGANKPSRDFFDKCFDRIPDFSRQTAVIVGDSLTSDILGGINAGIRTIWFNPSHSQPEGEIVPDYQISSLYELASILEKQCR